MAGPTQSPIGDPLLDRLERLAARQGRTTGPQPLPPPNVDAAPLKSTSPRRSGPGSQPSRNRRRHPARRARLGALVTSCAAAGGLAYFFAGAGNQVGATIPGIAAPITATEATPQVTTAPTTTATPNATAAGAASATTLPQVSSAVTTAAPAAGSLVAFDGDSVQTKYGPVQVQAQIQDGTLVAVAVVQYPDSDGKSVRINQRALPELQSEALTAQSAQVDTVSGATYTSNAYVHSLQSAIDEARTAGVMTA